jgi:hypothetical protein
MESRHNLLSEYAAKINDIDVAIFNFFYIKYESWSLANLGLAGSSLVIPN